VLPFAVALRQRHRCPAHAAVVRGVQGPTEPLRRAFRCGGKTIHRIPGIDCQERLAVGLGRTADEIVTSLPALIVTSARARELACGGRINVAMKIARGTRASACIALNGGWCDIDVAPIDQ